MNKLEPWYEPVDFVLDAVNFVCEMSREDHGFLCGAIKKVRPKKIVEIGVAEGGTTGIIMNALKMSGCFAEFYSVDLCEKFYRDSNLSTGYETERIKARIGYEGHHEFMLGQTIAGCIDKIGSDIDFILIDTTHSLPGELVDFLAVLPYCSKNAFVLLHDISLSNYMACSEIKSKIENCRNAVATKVLFSCVSADKYINRMNINIAGFMINEDTRKNIEDVFWALTLPWTYIPSSWIWNEYRDLCAEYYSEEQIAIFDFAFKNNRCVFNKQKLIRSEKYYEDFKSEYVFPIDVISRDADIVLYGAGCGGTDIRRQLGVTGYCNIVAWCDKNYKKFDVDMQIQSPELIQNLKYDYILVAVENRDVFEEIKAELCNIYYCDESKIIGPIDHQDRILYQ